MISLTGGAIFSGFELQHTATRRKPDRVYGLRAPRDNESEDETAFDKPTLHTLHYGLGANRVRLDCVSNLPSKPDPNVQKAYNSIGVIFPFCIVEFKGAKSDSDRGKTKEQVWTSTLAYLKRLDALMMVPTSGGDRDWNEYQHEKGVVNGEIIIPIFEICCGAGFWSVEICWTRVTHPDSYQRKYVSV